MPNCLKSYNLNLEIEMSLKLFNVLAIVTVGAMLALGSSPAIAHGIYKAHPFNEVDSNRDGLISKSEYEAHSAKHAKRNPKAKPIAEAHPFNELDPDNDGTISKKEYATHSAKHAKSKDHGHGTNK